MWCKEDVQLIINSIKFVLTYILGYIIDNILKFEINMPFIKI